ncbi:uncharacterized protein LOC115223123 [Argonauta hians]
MASLLLRLESRLVFKGTTTIPSRWFLGFASSHLQPDCSYSTTLAKASKGLMLGVYEGPTKDEPLRLSDAAKYFDHKCSGILSQRIKLFGKSFKKGKSHLLFGLCEEFPLVAVSHVGKEEQGYNELECRDEAPESVRAAVARGVSLLKDQGQDTVCVDPCGNPRAAAEGASLSLHSYDELKPKKKHMCKLQCYTSHLETTHRNSSEEEWRVGTIYAEAQNFARTLTEMPANILTPTRFSEIVSDRLSPYCQIIVRDQAWAEEQKMGAFLSVSQGSAEPLKFLEISYNNNNNSSSQSSPPVVLVGKGITFDTGGISLKPPSNMDKMRGDMGGAGCVVGAVLGVCQLALPINLKALIPLCENMIGGKAVKPGDVVTAMNGTTIQVDNTDAEGRLILADALCYAETFNPRLVMDMATLTGAITIALGSGAAGTYTNSSALWDLLYQSGSATGDRLWRLPLFQHYTNQITHSQLAALNNIGKYIRAGGSPVAAAFLKEFVKCDNWIHLDISGVRMNIDEVPYLGRGMAGRPTRTVIEFLSRYNQETQNC